MPRIVELVVRIDEALQPASLRRQIEQAVDIGALHHPCEGMIRKPGPRIAATDIGVNADKPYLADALAVDIRECRAGIRR
jgi:hypothetical protein